MKRAILLTTGTVAGLVSVLSYSPLGNPTAVLADAAGAPSGLGGPSPASGSSDQAAAPDGATASQAGASPAAHGGGAAATSAAKSSAAPSARSSAPTTKASSTASKTAAAPVTHAAATTHVAAHPTTTSKAPSKPPTTTHKPTSAPPAAPRDFTGNAITYKYGTIQVAIRVQGGKITDAWAVSYPGGSSQPYSEMAIPILRSQTIAAQSARISGATGASETSASWIKSLASALSKAGL